jgi:serine/threonine protein kinase
MARVFQYCGCGDLAQKVERYKRRRQNIEEDVIWRYFIQCLKALTLLHEKGICHRDLKTANTFIADDGSVKIGDMNVSKRLQSGLLKTQIGTPYYMSPEIWNNRPYDGSSDIWALGCMMYELCALRPPFLGDSFPALKRAVVSGQYPPIPSKYSNALRRTIDNMLKLQPSQRLTALGALQSQDVSSKLHLDHCEDNVALERQLNGLDLMATIKLPQNMKKLGSVLPKACYPDMRPNTPTAWTVSEQMDQQPAQQPPPPQQSAERVAHEKPSKFKAVLENVSENELRREPSISESDERSVGSQVSKDAKVPSDRVRRVIQHQASKQQLQRVPSMQNNPSGVENAAPIITHHKHNAQPAPQYADQYRARNGAPAPMPVPTAPAGNGPRYNRPSRIW